MIAIAKRLILSVISLGAMLLLAELATRLMCRACDPSGGVKLTLLPDGNAIGVPNTRARQVKNTGDYDVAVAFNALGFRDAKSFDGLRGGRLFVVGDSFAFGWGVEEHERFSNRLEAILGQPVFNIAAPSADLDSYASLLRYAESRGAHIGTLVVSVCMENDLRVYNAPTSDQSQAADPPFSFGASKAWLADHSALRFAITRVIHGTPWMTRAAVRAGLVIPNAQSAAVSDVSKEAIVSSADRIRQLIAGREAKVLIIPSRGLWLGTPEHRAAIDRAHASFVQRLQERRISVVDVRGFFERGGNPLALHFPNDGHWTVEGHRIAAEALAAAIGRHRH